MKSLLNFSVFFDYFRDIGGGERFNRILVSEYLPRLDHVSLLDLGCGTGTIINHIPKSVHYRGVDINDKYIEAARERYSGMGDFVCTDLERYDSEDRFDVIICIGVLHHLANDSASRLISKATQLLKSGGTMLTCDGVFLKDQPWLAGFLLKNDRGAFVRSIEGYSNLWQEAGIDRPTFSIRQDLLRIPFSHIIFKYSS